MADPALAPHGIADVPADPEGAGRHGDSGDSDKADTGRGVVSGSSEP